MAVGIFTAQVSDLDHALKGARAAHDLAVDGPNRNLIQRSVVTAEDILQDLFFTGRRENITGLVLFDLADLDRKFGAVVDQLQNLLIELVDLVAESVETRGRAAVAGGRSALGL